jgi:hypothetical protein
VHTVEYPLASLATFTAPTARKGIRASIDRGAMLGRVELASLTTEASASRLGQHLTSCDLPEIARVAEMLAQCTLMSVQCVAAVVENAARVSARALSEARPSAKPRCALNVTSCCRLNESLRPPYMSYATARLTHSRPRTCLPQTLVRHQTHCAPPGSLRLQPCSCAVLGLAMRRCSRPWRTDSWPWQRVRHQGGRRLILACGSTLR